MINAEQLHEFVAMWKWLSAHPVNDRAYYLKYVVKGKSAWINDCPIATGEGAACTGCHMFWPGENGNLCSDSQSPLSHWQATSVEQPDLRIYYAGNVGTLGLQALRSLGVKAGTLPEC
ncbi:MAG: hypothetical protein Q8R88_01980 [Desulfoprunum sp.]|nr:hypothetical protein [Desulfoprunum sp.]